MVAPGTPWYRGKEIASADFLATEAYLVDRWDFGGWERPRTGMLERFRLDGSVLFHTAEDGSFLLGATDLAGVTDRGHPVVLGENEYLELALPADTRGFELWLVCNPDWGEPRTDDAPKYLLSIEPEATPCFGGRLSLGVWAVNADGELVMQALPTPARLGSFLPHSAFWEQWVSPFRKALAEHLAMGRIGPESDWKQLLWIAELSDLASEWIGMPVVELASRCRFARWLADGGNLNANVATSPAPPPLPDLSGQSLPQTLVDLLGKPVRTSAPAAPKARQGDPGPTTAAVALRFMSPDTLLVRFPPDTPHEMSLCVSLASHPPARLQVRAGASPQGFRVSGEINGEPRATVMVYRLPSPPASGETWRFSPLDGAAAAASYLSG